MKKEQRNKARARAEAIAKARKDLREGRITKTQMKQKTKVRAKVGA